MGVSTGFLRPELLIVGAGPAGVSAALWARTQGLSFMVLEGAPAPGGQLHHVLFRPRELPGLAADGLALAASYRVQLEEAGIAVRYDTVALALEPPGKDGASPCVTTSSGERFEAAAVLVATGIRRRHLDVPGERELEGQGVSYSATRDRAAFAGGDVVVVGGGDAAYENALLLAEVGCRVTLAVRGVPRARQEFRERVEAERAIRVLPGTHVTALLGDGRLTRVRFEGPNGPCEQAAKGIVIKVGSIPNTEWCRKVLDHDPEGHLVVDERFRTSLARVWAAGDVTHPPLLAITVAYGAGAVAVADIRSTLRGG